MSMTLAIDGVALDDPDGRWNLTDETEYLSGLSATVAELSIPGMDGSAMVPQSMVTPTKTVAMIVSGCDDRDLKRNVSALLSLLRDARSLSRSIDGTEQTVVCQFKDSQPVRYWPDLTANLLVSLRLPGIFWRGRTAPWSVPAPASGTAYTVTSLDGSTAPIDDALILIDGPVTNPKLSCGDQWFALDLTLAEGESALVDVARWQVRAGSGVTFAGGGTVKTGVLTTSGGPYMLRLRPSMVVCDPTVTRVQVALSYDSGTPALSIQAAPAYLV